MADGQIDPARLDGDALTRWYLRSPADIEEGRQAAAAQRYADFFGNASQPPNEDYDTSADQSPPDLDNARFGHGGLRAVAYGGGLDDGVYRPGHDSAQITPTADTVWNCPTCHGRLPLPVPLIPPQLQPGQPLFREIPPSSGGASRRNWRDKSQCNQQFENDRKICQKAKSAQCWENQMRRLDYCNRTDLITWPELGFGPRGR